MHVAHGGVWLQSVANRSGFRVTGKKGQSASSPLILKVFSVEGMEVVDGANLAPCTVGLRSVPRRVT